MDQRTPFRPSPANRENQRFAIRPILRGLLCLLITGSPASAQIVNSEWNTGNGNWNVAANWSPATAPDNGTPGGFTYNVQIGNRPVAANAQVTFIPVNGTGDTVLSLAVSGGADLFTSGSQLNVPGQTTVDGAGTTVRVDSHNTPGLAAFVADNLDLNTGGGLTMSGGIANVNVQLEINAGSVIGGHGTINVGDADAGVEQAFENSGLLQPQANTAAPQTLTIHGNGVDTIDLDGDTETGVVDVDNVLANANADTVTLVIDGPLADPFGGIAGASIQIGQRDTLTFNDDLTISGPAAISMAGGGNVATLNGPGSITSIASATFSVTGAAAVENDMAFTGAANTITVNANSSLALGGTVTIPDASAVSLTSSSTLVVSGATTVTEAAGDFNWDGPGVAATTVQGSGLLTLTVNRVDTTDDVYGGTLSLNDNGDVSVDNVANLWTMAGTLNKNNVGTSILSGDAVNVTGSVNVNAGQLSMPVTTLSPGALITVNGTLALGGPSILAGPATVGGTGILRMSGVSSVSANTTIGVSTFDWDGLGTGTNHTINSGVVFTINSTFLDSDGDMDDPFILAGSGSQLIVNGPAEWTSNGIITANAAAIGTATIGGTSRMILNGTMNVDGGTTISAPLTFGAGASASIDSAMTLNANGSTVYSGGSISGLGTYNPGPANIVTASSTINPINFQFDAGNWTVQDNAQLTVNVTDYDPAAATNAFDATLNLNDGDISVTTGDVEFVMDGVLNMSSTVEGQIVAWNGEPLGIGNDAGVLDADLNVTGNRQSQIASVLDFNSDADVNIASGATLALLGTVSFNTVNGANNAEFTGAGTIAFSGGVNVSEAVTLNLAGGTVDLDGLDNVGDFINIDAPMTINAATMSSFGRSNGGGGVNTLDINNSVGLGVLTVNLDSASGEWTLNSQGVLNLVNDNTEATLLVGNGMNLNGTVNVTGDARSTARLDIGGTVNINTAGQPLRLGGGNTGPDVNTIVGGTITGVGLLGADTGKALHGFGTINADIDFDGTANVRATGGTLTLGGDLVDVNILGTADATGTLNVVNAWETDGGAGGIIGAVVLNGGILQGGMITNDSLTGLQGHGTVTSRVINSGRIVATNGGTLIVQTAGNNNDWDGAANTGELEALSADLEMIDTTSPFIPIRSFGGRVRAINDNRVFANGFALDFNPGSSLELEDEAVYQASGSTDIGGTVTIGAGAGSTIQVANNYFLTFETGSSTTLSGDLSLINNNINIEQGATFAGTGALAVPSGSHLIMDANANVNVLLNLQGALRPGNFNGVGRVDVRDFQESGTSQLFLEFTGTNLNQFDRMVVNGSAVIDGYLNLDIDEVSPGVPFVPVVGQTFNIISASGGVTGTFDAVGSSGMPPGLTFRINYLPTLVQVEVISGADFEQWISLFPSLTNPADRLKTADPDQDGRTNLVEFAFDGDPTKAGGDGKIVGKIAPVAGVNAMTITFPMHNGPYSAADPPGGEKLLIGLGYPDLYYRVQASDNLTTFLLTVDLVEGTDALAIQAGMPPLHTGWSYATCRSPGPVAGDPLEFMRIGVGE